MGDGAGAGLKRRGFLHGGKRTAPSSLSGCIIGLLVVVSFRELLSNVLGASDVMPDAVTIAVYIAAFSILGTLAAVITAIMPVIPILRTEPYEAIKQGKTT